ncbi:hypothetical protein Tco_1029702 [Tanacetum coccineum]|uniref:Uncharacterized protein n=1 Tax=Tanacetum coccineum TaxID=301880 RepID=A0ABQ5G4E9_9ASTR
MPALSQSKLLDIRESWVNDYVASAPLLEQWDRCNVVVLNWILSSFSQDVESNILTKLPDCTCEAKAELIDHGKLLRLMQFLMGLDDVYQPIRSSLLTRKILPEVKDAFVIDLRKGKVVGYGSKFVGLYLFDKEYNVSTSVNQNFVLEMLNKVTPPDKYSVQGPSGGVTSLRGEHAGRSDLVRLTIPTTIPDTTPVITPPATQTDTPVIPTETPIITPTIPPSPDYTPASPDYSP